MLTALLLLAVGSVAFTNGANANFKGVATLYGSGTTTLRRALYWGTAATFAGSLASAYLARGLLAAFGGRGLVPDELARSPAFAGAAAAGAALTSLLATRLGFPVSTTHALVGGLVGAGLAGGAGGVRPAPLLRQFVYPLLVGPVVAAGLAAVAYPLLRLARLAPPGRARTVDALHVLGGGAASFARGLNDTPKVAAPLLVVPGLDPPGACLLVAGLIALGGLVDAGRVAETLGKKVTAMTPGQGFAASLVTAGLVTTASLHSLPLSTTHVCVGALLGIGATTGQAKWRKAGEILTAWAATAPCGAALAAVAYAVAVRL